MILHKDISKVHTKRLLSKQCRNYVLFKNIVKLFWGHVTTFCKLFSQTYKKMVKKLALKIKFRVVFGKPILFVNIQTRFLMFSCAVLQASSLEFGVTIFIA